MGDASEGCGPSACGACEEGCSTAEECVDGGWVCDCDCPVDDTDGHACTVDEDCTEGECIGVPDTRDAARACQSEPELWLHACDTPGPMGNCCSDEDCTAGSFGDGQCAAIGVGYCGGPAPPEGNTCRYDECSTDADCADEYTCLPAGVLGSLTRRCIQASCDSHDDCSEGAGGFCSLLYSSQTCPEITLGCTYSDSECRRAQGCDSWPDRLCVVSADGQNANCLEHQPAP